jgi:hypothetical protein
MNRVCSVCKIEKDLKEFYKSKKEKLGREYRCKSCSSKKMKKYIEKDRAAWNKRTKDWRDKKKSENPNFYKNKYIKFKKSYSEYQKIKLEKKLKEDPEYYRKVYFKNKEKYAEYGKKNLEKNRKKHNARAKIYRHIKAGKIIKPQICSKCDNQGKIEAHHHDYEKPLEVTWLCTKCHRKEDLIMRENK